jgi:hypothetical protein
LAPIVYYTRRFPFLWGELSVALAGESDLNYAMGLLERVALEVIGDRMREPARAYEAVLRRENLNFPVAERPEVYASMTESGIELTIRYMVGATEKRVWKSRN